MNKEEYERFARHIDESIALTTLEALSLRDLNDEIKNQPTYIHYRCSLNGKNYNMIVKNPYKILEAVQGIFNGRPETMIIDNNDFSPRMN